MDQPKTYPAISELLNRLADFEPAGFPVLSLYLNTQPDEHGRERYDPWLRKELNSRAKTYMPRSAERESFDRDSERIEQFLTNELQPSAKSAVIFACDAANHFWEALQLEAAIPEHRLYVSEQPHLYGLARLMDEYRRYAALVADTNSARLFVFGLGRTLEARNVTNIKAKRVAVGGWSQARYQRHVENFHLQHAKEIIDILDRVVREENIPQIILAGDEVIVPLLREQLPKHLDQKVIDILALDITTPEHEVLEATLDAFRRRDARDDAERVGRLLDDFRGGGLATSGVEETRRALDMGQVDELLLSTSLEREPGKEDLADELVIKAAQTGARVTFIEDPALLAPVEGVGAFLRYHIDYTEKAA